MNKETCHAPDDAVRTSGELGISRGESFRKVPSLPGLPNGIRVRVAVQGQRDLSPVGGPVSSLHILSGGAAQSLVNEFRGAFYNETGRNIEGHFGAVGAMRDRLLSGDPCDVLILTDALIDELTIAGRVQPGSARPLGRVRIGVAVRGRDTPPSVDTAESFKNALLAARGIYFPDPQRSTAGQHFAGVLRRLGIVERLSGSLRPHPNGATALREMIASDEPGLIACTQLTEIRGAPQVTLAGLLPREFELTTVYTAAVASRAEQPQAARALVDLLSSPGSAEQRRAGGFE